MHSSIVSKEYKDDGTNSSLFIEQSEAPKPVNRNLNLEKLSPSMDNRDQWSNKIEYMLSVIGYVVDLGNCIRFPYVTYKNGGGAFLLPYFTFLILIGVPMMYMEMSIGQYFHVGNISLWGKVNVYTKGIH